MPNEAITIMAKALAEDMGLAYPKYLAERHATAAIAALRAAGYWVERWRPIEGAPKDGKSATTGASAPSSMPRWAKIGTYRGNGVYDAPPPPVQSEGGGG
ncbi:hypothetical protein FHS82_000985 [Pseudochelatococcus lubricantis]|uniref:Uncharacterized protein n=1 Tax=Pseudochelatococcus lubricantis TaxID=1538102 RepID=A0ABX0UZ69_9HYPH|nr:hypothetical protein [Pseudochelatococcus lubricantis]